MGKRLEIVEEALKEEEFREIQKSIKRLSETLAMSTKKYDDSLRAIKGRFDNIEQAMDAQNKNLQIVYESTVGAVFDKLIKLSLDYLADFGEFCVKIAERVWNSIKSIEWKVYYDTITDPKQQQLFKDWVYGIYQYVTFWWTEGIYPAIVRQATNLYFGVQRFAKQSIEYIHSHGLYNEMMLQSEPYLKMANIPMEYNGYIVDGVLVLFVLSSLMTLSFVLGLFCDCCCPRKPLKVSPATSGFDGSNGVKQKKHRKRKR